MRYDIFKLLVISLFAIFLASCAKSGSDVSESTSDDSGAMTAGAGSASEVDGEEAGSSSQLSQSEMDEITRMQELLETRSVYFAYDDSAVTDEAKEVLSAHAQRIQTLPNTMVVLEGHADERGTREYNLALGDRRAESVKRLLAVLGVDVSRISTLSLGEEAPAELGHDEESYRLNRRVDILYDQ